MVEIRNGLSEGEQIVVVGGNTLRDGMTVRAIDAAAAEAPAGSPPGGNQRVGRPGAGGATPAGAVNPGGSQGGNR
jgi:hypothetical protein